MTHASDDLPNISRRSADAHKGDFGRVLLIGGSRGMAGSISLSAIAALRSGSGLVSVAVPDVCLETVAGFEPALMTIPLPCDASGRFAIEAAAEMATFAKQADAIAVGPGMRTTTGSIALVHRLVCEISMPMVLDADALTILSGFDRSTLPRPADISRVLTPHPGEWERICGVSASDRGGQVEAARTYCEDLRCIVVLKGGPTVVIGPGRTWVNTTGNPGMATAGSGDVLTGIVASLLSQGFNTWDAARLAVHHHGLAGDAAAHRRGQAAMISSDLLDHLRPDSSCSIDNQPQAE